MSAPPHVWITARIPDMQQNQIIKAILHCKIIARLMFKHLGNKRAEAAFIDEKKCHIVNISETC